MMFYSFGRHHMKLLGTRVEYVLIFLLLLLVETFLAEKEREAVSKDNNFPAEQKQKVIHFHSKRNQEYARVQIISYPP